MRGRTAAAVGVAALAGVLAAPAGAGAGVRGFTGSCTLTGVVRFYPALGTAVRPGRAVAVAAGTCSGTLTSATGRRRVDQAPARYRAAERGALMGCALGVDAGSGWLQVDGVYVPFRIAEKRVAAAAAAQLAGRGWSGLLVAAASPQANPATVAAQCVRSALHAAPIQGNIRATSAP